MASFGTTVAIDCVTAETLGDNRHPLSIAQQLGIEYAWAEPRPVDEACLLHGCTRVPSRLPIYVRPLD
ncbi:hypothetical protein [Mangrovibrevibacter kandeliae]|uniref:hypothetical protein n=1 Tax=Mangrovibrevibacter kandeliae TaxID=2968473 RepID=UPI00211938AA|nr:MULTISPECIES: hypothetical protein [unclassified Aurantimonas]MCQ8783438.1 hypothetical protein [Aurantimonas sp. CSK15Z-1]MCW4116046.1 hypothetical protein [Aurantimonas sp. MSK8Z-1]